MTKYTTTANRSGCLAIAKCWRGIFVKIPDLYFNIQLLICEPRRIASRLGFDCTPRGSFVGLEINGRKVSFAENVFYEFDGR